jgi:hypothetical protein
MSYSKITVKMDKFNITRPNINGLGFGMLNWGPIALPIDVDYLNYQYQIGEKCDENDIFYQDLLSYLEYSPQSLLAYRVSPRTNTGTFDSSGDLISSIGVTHSHLFMTGELESADMSTETQISASVSMGQRGGFGLVNYNDDLYLTGGTDGTTYYDDVWKSTDNGLTWTQIKTGAAFGTLAYHGMIVYDGKMWVIAGTTNGIAGQDHVFSSTDGITWTDLGATAVGTRMQFGLTVHDGKMWVAGGFLFSLGAIVATAFSSTDGITWSAETALPYAVQNHGIISKDSKLWLIGGSSRNQVYSDSGTGWVLETTLADNTDQFALLETDDKIFIVGGTYNSIPDFRIYETVDCITWTVVDTSSTSITPRYDSSGVITSDNKIIYMGGFITIFFPPFIDYFQDEWSIEFTTAHGFLPSIWNENYNGSDLYLKLNEQIEAINTPTFHDLQIMAIMAKYAGDYGDNLKVTIASYLDNLNQITLFNESDNLTRNYYLSELFNRKLNINEHVMVVCKDGVILDKFIFSLDNTDIRYIDNIECAYLDFYVNPNYTKAISSDTDLDKKKKAIYNTTYTALSLGNSGFNKITNADYERDLELLKDRYYADFRIIFTSGDNTTIHEYAKNVVNQRGDAELIICAHEKFYYTSIFGFDSYGLSATGSVVSLSFNVYDYYETIDSKNVAFFYNYKKIDVNGTIKNHSIAGDLAGTIVQAMINMKFKEIGFLEFGNNILSINDLDNIVINSLNLSYVNVMARSGLTYKIKGDCVMKDVSYGLNYQMIKLYVISAYLSWSDLMTHENMDDELSKDLDKLTENINTMLSNYTTEFQTYSKINMDEFRVTLEISFKINDVYEGISILLRDVTNL